MEGARCRDAIAGESTFEFVAFTDTAPPELLESAWAQVPPEPAGPGSAAAGPPAVVPARTVDVAQYRLAVFTEIAQGGEGSQ